MASSSGSSDTLKIPRYQNWKGFAQLRHWATEVVHCDDFLHVVTETPPNPHASTNESRAQWRKGDQKARLHIALNLGEELAGLITSLMFFDYSKKEV